MRSVVDILADVAIFSSAIPLIIGIIRRHPLKSFLIYLGLFLACELSCEINILFVHKNNLWLDNLFILFETIYLMHLLIIWLNPKHQSPIFYLLVFFWFLSWILFMLQKGGLYVYNSPAHLLQSLLIITMSAYFLYKLSLESSSILKEATFWISGALLLSNTLLIAFYIVAAKVNVNGGTPFRAFRIIQHIGAITSFLMFSIGLLCNWKESKSSLASSR